MPSACSTISGVILALLNAQIENAIVGIFCDPAAADAAHAVGQGANITLSLGGRSGPEGVEPLAGTFLVRQL